MSIPNAGNYDEPPPPLPPPRFVPVDGPTVFDPRSRDHDDGFFPEDRETFKSRDRSYRPDLDEGYHSIGSARTLNSPHFSMHNSYQFRPRADAYDTSMLDKLNARRPLDNRSPTQWSGLSSSAMDSSTRPTPMQLPKLLSLPDRTRSHQPMLDSPHRYNHTPLVSAVSPRSNPFRYGPSQMGDYRSPLSADTGDFDQSPYPRTRRRNSGSIADDATVSTQGSNEMRDDDIDFPMEETSRLHMLNIDDASRDREKDRGQKRRASSPPEDNVVPLASDMFRRRDINGMFRGSPTPRLSPIPQSSVSSISSAGRSATSYASMTSASSLTSMGSFGRISPNGPSPISPADTAGYESSYTASLSLVGSARRSSNSRGVAVQQPHQRTLTGLSTVTQESRPLASPRKHGEPPKSNGSILAAKMQGFFMCECCPKKPKKFDSPEELSAHEAEKQYECSFCGNRFKNKNEAERHQNSLHVRRHSWSCSALTGYERAFHDSTTCPGEADICGYCGEEFTRTGYSTAASGRFITDADWELRIHHLQDVHKFRECNASKKFYRADHFRQHLKHSHAGTSGKWTNMLENACMIEEEPPIISR
ncbi:hypothetical protein BR93DRAFT_884138 [Coniochaeta sp. PMI_546]|nr:hypothetical protein BR93DRAFT_884138 [Coniochaeta sp. PMI_546]